MINVHNKNYVTHHTIRYQLSTTENTTTRALARHVASGVKLRSKNNLLYNRGLTNWQIKTRTYMPFELLQMKPMYPS